VLKASTQRDADPDNLLSFCCNRHQICIDEEQLLELAEGELEEHEFEACTKTLAEEGKELSASFSRLRCRDSSYRIDIFIE